VPASPDLRLLCFFYLTRNIDLAVGKFLFSSFYSSRFWVDASAAAAV
jgi:hypothetical protein